MADAYPEVTLLMGTFHSEAFVENALRSLLAQDYPNLRMVVCDDASTDGTLARCRDIAGDDPRVEIRQNPRNLGWAENYRQLLDGVSSAYVAFAFHDDVLAPDYVRKAIARLEANTNAVVAYSDLFQKCPLTERALADHLYSGGCSRFQRCRRLLLNRGHWWIAFRGVVRRDAAVAATSELVQSVGGGVSADWFWCLKLASLGDFERIPEVLTFKNLRKRGVSQSWSDPPWRRVVRLIRGYRMVAGLSIPIWEKIGLLGTFPMALAGTAWHAFKRRMKAPRTAEGVFERSAIASSSSDKNGLIGRYPFPR
jgi:glycosyltransferase involved in cell wall biosynthesis